MSLTSLESVKSHLRIGTSVEDILLMVFINAAEVYVNEYCDTQDAPFTTLPPPVAAAVLLIVGDLYENREGQGEKQLYTNKTVEYLLTPYRNF